MNNYKSDYLSVWMRREADKRLWERIESARVKSRQSNEYPLKLFPLAVDFPAANASRQHFERYRTFLRSDHRAFWVAFEHQPQMILPSVLFTDLGKTIETLCKL